MEQNTLDQVDRFLKHKPLLIRKESKAERIMKKMFNGYPSSSNRGRGLGRTSGRLDEEDPAQTLATDSCGLS